jgi:deazaflavin-dependent oxidoreductase (nitroreductase family)
VANPRATVEVGTDTFDVEARVAEGDERELLWNRQTEQYPNFAEYAAMTTRQIPVVVLEPVR